MHNLLSSHDAGIQTDVAVLVFSKTFDTVSHRKLLHKLDQYWVRGTVHTWLTNFLTKRKMSCPWRHGIRGSFSHFRSAPRHSSQSFTISVPHEWLNWLSEVDSAPFHRWLSPIPRDSQFSWLPHPTVWPQTAGRMGQAVGDALQCRKVLHPLTTTKTSPSSSTV